MVIQAEVHYLLPFLLVSKFIRLGVSDKNEHVPYFEKAVFELDIDENKDIDHPLLTVAPSDRKDSRVRYEITRGNLGNAFALTKSGVLYLATPLDYETVQRYELRLAASNMHSASFATVLVRVKDLNDNPPVFERPFYRTQITEEDDRNLPKKVLQVVALDADKNRPKNIIYSLTGQGVDSDNPINNKFEIGRTSGEIFVLKPLNRDEPKGRPLWKFTVFAQDEGGDGLVGYADVQVNLKDINDNAPTFSQGVYYTNVTENSTAGEFIMKLEAVDYDDPEESGNADVVYSIEKNVVEEESGLPIFQIDSQNGEVTTAVCCLDREKTPDYVIQVVAVDGGGMKGTGTVSIKVADVNDMPPRFVKDEWTTEVDESNGDELPTNPILTVTVHDDDENNDFYYTVVKGSGVGSEKFSMTRNPDGTGGLKVIQPLDFEESRVPFRFKIQVKDTGKDGENTPYHTASAWITVKLRDINDNPPQIDRLHESVMVDEDARVGTILETFRAKDLDQRGRSKVTFRIDRSSDPDRQFAITEDGVVTIQRPLDREAKALHVLRIMAVDDGLPPKTSTATLRITVKDVNDNAPVFLEEYQVTVTEGDSPNVIATLSAVDADNYTAGHGPPFSFMLDPDAPSDIQDSFKVTQETVKGNTTAVVSAIRTFDREEKKTYQVPIIIEDSGQPKMVGTSILTVIVGDINDNLMSPGSKEIFVYNYMGQMPDADIGRVYVTDPDDWDVVDKTTSWDGLEHRSFRLKEDTGMITLRQGTPDGTYNLRFKVFDRRHVQSDVVANVSITLQEIPYQAVTQASSIRITGITCEQFIGISDHSKENIPIKSKLELLREKLAELLKIKMTSVHVITVSESSEKPPSVDVWYSARADAFPTYFSSVHLQAVTLLHWSQIESHVGLNISMVGVRDCQEENRSCGGSCTNIITRYETPKLIDANATALVGVNLQVSSKCECGAISLSKKVHCVDKPCLNGGRCSENKYGYKCTCGRDFTGPRCQQRARSFRGSGWAWYRPLQPCLKSHLSLEFVTSKPEGQLVYNGPVTPTKPGLEKVSDYISLELHKGNPRLLIDFGSGTLELGVKTKKGLNDGEWHRLDVLWKKQEVTLVVDFCKEASMNETEDGSWVELDESGCRVQGVTPNFHEHLDLNTPLQVGGLHTLQLDPTLFHWKAVPYGVGFDGCIRNIFFNGELYDLSRPGLSRGSAPGCPQTEHLCAHLSCGASSQGLCEASMTGAHCECHPGYTGPSCSSITIPAHFRPLSYVKYALSFEPDRFSNHIQLRFRTRESKGELFRAGDQNNKEHIVVEIVEGKLRFRFNLNAAATQETEVWLRGSAVSDGQWHSVSALRHGCTAILALDGGESALYNETFLPCSHRWLLVDKQEGVYVGGKAEYTGVRTFDVESDFHSGCLDDVRLDGRPLPLPPAMNGTQWGQATMARNLDRYCPSNDSCANTACPEPFQCLDLWQEYECSCGEGRLPTPDGNDCVDVNECLDSPCRNGGVCVNQEPRTRYRCLCPVGFLGKNCDVTQEKQMVKLGMGALATILGCLLLILVLVLVIVIYNRRREVVVKKPRPEDDVRENIISYNDEGGGEDDMTAYNAAQIQVPLSTSSTGKTDIIELSTVSEDRDWGPSLSACKSRADADVTVPPFDDLRNYAYEGGNSIAGSLSSLVSEADSIQRFDLLENWGPKFFKLSLLYQNAKEAHLEDEEDTVY